MSTSHTEHLKYRIERMAFLIELLNEQMACAEDASANISPELAEAIQVLEHLACAAQHAVDLQEHLDHLGEQLDNVVDTTTADPSAN